MCKRCRHCTQSGHCPISNVPGRFCICLVAWPMIFAPARWTQNRSVDYPSVLRRVFHRDANFKWGMRKLLEQRPQLDMVSIEL
jgi:hypothetical protein